MRTVLGQSGATEVRPLWYALRGAALMSFKAMLLGVWVFTEAARTRNAAGATRMLVILALFWGAGAVGGLAYVAAKVRGVRYYTRWVIGAEVAFAAFVVELMMLRAMLPSGGAEQTDQPVADFFFTHPAGVLLLAVVAAAGGVIYGRVLRD